MAGVGVAQMTAEALGAGASPCRVRAHSGELHKPRKGSDALNADVIPAGRVGRDCLDQPVPTRARVRVGVGGGERIRPLPLCEPPEMRLGFQALADGLLREHVGESTALCLLSCGLSGCLFPSLRLVTVNHF